MSYIALISVDSARGSNPLGTSLKSLDDRCDISLCDNNDESNLLMI